MNKKNWKETIGEFWREHNEQIKFGAKMLGIGFAIGIVRGVMYNSDLYRELVSKIPNAPVLDSIEDMIVDMDDAELLSLKDAIEQQLQLS